MRAIPAITRVPSLHFLAKIVIARFRAPQSCVDSEPNSLGALPCSSSLARSDVNPARRARNLSQSPTSRVYPINGNRKSRRRTRPRMRNSTSACELSCRRRIRRSEKTTPSKSAFLREITDEIPQLANPLHLSVDVCVHHQHELVRLSARSHVLSHG